jgi:modification methylase
MSDVKLYCGDCLDILPTLKAGSIDAVIFSPPYNCRKPYTTFKDEMPWPEYYIWMRKIINECYRVLTTGGVIAVNVPGVIRWQADHEYNQTWGDFDPGYKTHRDGEQVIGKGRIEPLGIRIFEMMQECDPHIREPIIWVKGSENNAICSDYRMGCDSDPYMRPAHEWILVGSKDRWFHRGGTGRRGRDAVPFIDYTKDVWFMPPDKSNHHPAPFPIDLPERIIKLFTHANDAVICDPFMGKGTTGVAAAKLRRPFIGIEIDPGYYRTAKQRIEEVRQQLTLPILEGGTYAPGY